MSASAILAFIATTTLLLFAVSFASLIRLSRAGVLEGRSADGAPSPETLSHSIIKLILVLVITVAQSRVLLAPERPGGPFAPDLSMLLASAASLVASIPAVALVALLARRETRPNLFAVTLAVLAATAASGVGQAVMSGIAAGRDLGSLLAPSAVLPLLVCGMVAGAGVYLHTRLILRIIANPRSSQLALADAALSAATTSLSVWLACLAFPATV